MERQDDAHSWITNKFTKGAYKYKIKIAVIQETRWIRKGIRDTKIPHNIIQWKGRRQQRIWSRLIVNKNLKSKIIDFRLINERICILKMKAKFRNIILINIYCPMDDKNEDIKEAFYQHIEQAYDSTPRNDIMIIGDMNQSRLGKKRNIKE